MPSFNSYSDGQAVAHTYRDAVIVYVEGGSDIAILKKMFPDHEPDMLFELPIEGTLTGGCTAVRVRVQDERRSNPRVVGLLDRDALHRDCAWAALFEPDNATFRRLTCVEGIHVLTRWEIENYLMDPKAVLELMRHWGERRNISEDELLDLMIEASVDELAVTAGFCTAHHFGMRQAAPPSPHDDRGMEAATRRWLQGGLGRDEPLYEEHLAKVRAFDPGERADKSARLADLLRMVDGKRLLARLQRQWANLRDDPMHQLATNVKNHGARTDLHEMIDDWRNIA